jgi:cytosine/adenosine deaminase-related metal-dependent hydrolase
MRSSPPTHLRRPALNHTNGLPRIGAEKVMKGTRIWTASWLLPVSSAPIHNGALAIRNNRISEVEPFASVRRKYKSAQAVQFGRCAIMPGMVDSHAHLSLTRLHERHTFRGLCELMKAATDLHKECDVDTLQRAANRGGISARETMSPALLTGDTVAYCKVTTRQPSVK